MKNMMKKKRKIKIIHSTYNKNVGSGNLSVM